MIPELQTKTGGNGQEERTAQAKRRALDIPPDGLNTPYGRLYRPLEHWQQIGMLIGAFFGGPGMGWLAAMAIGDLSETAATVLYIPYVLVFMAGYSLWIARLNVIAFQGLGRPLLKALFMLIVFRRKPASVEEVLPTHEKLLEMMVRAQKAGASFAAVSWPIGLAAGAGALFFDSTRGAAAVFLIVCASCLLWGYVLAYWGRRGWLPFAEEN